MTPWCRCGGHGGDIGEDGAGDLAIVEGDHRVADRLGRLVTFAGDDHDVARLGHRDRRADGHRPVDLDGDARAVVIGDPSEDLVDDARRVLRAGIVGRDHHEVGETGGDCPHLGALRSIPVSAGAEHEDHPSTIAHQRTGRGDHLLEPIRCVGEVDDDVDRRRGAGVDGDPLEAAGHDARRTESGNDGIDADPDRFGGRRRGQCVVHVEGPSEGDPDACVAPGEGDRRRGDLDVRDFVDAVRHHFDRRGIEQSPSVRIVDVDDSDHRPTGLEQQRLGAEVLLDSAVQVEMIASEIGEHGGVEAGAVDAMQGQGV